MGSNTWDITSQVERGTGTIYRLVEVVSPTGYKHAAVSFYVNADGTVSFITDMEQYPCENCDYSYADGVLTIQNQRVDVNLKKVDAQGNVMSGVTFQLLDVWKDPVTDVEGKEI